MAIPSPFKTRVAAAARKWSGYLRWQEGFPRGLTVLVYHGVVESLRGDALDAYSIDWRTLRSHVRHFKRIGKVVPMSWLRDCLLHGDIPDPRWILITFDDALQSQACLGAELLASEGVPWSISIPAGLVGTDRTIWSYEIRLLLSLLWDYRSIDLHYNQEPYVPMGLTRAETIGQILRDLLHSTPDHIRQAYIEKIRNAVGAERINDAIINDGRFKMASWAELRRLAENGVDILSHGWLHRPHNSTMSDNAFTEEVLKSRQEIHIRLGRPPDVFVYPNGIHDSVRRPEISHAGYKLCFSTTAGRIGSDSDMMCLPRFDGEYSLQVLRHHLLCHG